MTEPLWEDDRPRPAAMGPVKVRVPAKINLHLGVGPLRADGFHELATVYHAIALYDEVTVRPADSLALTMDGEGAGQLALDGTNLVIRAVHMLAAATGRDPHARVHLRKQIPLAAGLGGGSADAAAALLLANTTLERPLDAASLHALAATLGADVPLSLTSGPQLGAGDGTELTPLELPRDYSVVVLLPAGASKHSTKAIYDAFDDRRGELGFDERRAELLSRVRAVASVTDLASWPKNDLAGSRFAGELERLGASRSDVSGAGPAVYGLFEDEAKARAAAHALGDEGLVWVTFPAWYG